FNDTQTTEIYTTRHTLSLHDALPIYKHVVGYFTTNPDCCVDAFIWDEVNGRSEEHTSELQSLLVISYAVFCLKKKSSTAFVVVSALFSATLVRKFLAAVC